MSILSSEFVSEDNPVQIAKNLLGVEIRHYFDDLNYISALISETEAYMAPEDKASHAWNNRRTERTEPLFGNAGFSYVYLCYGIHNLFNVVTGSINTPHAVLIRAIIPLSGQAIQLINRKKKKFKSIDFTGPGKVTQALGITLMHNKINLLSTQSPIQLHQGIEINPSQIKEGKRIGIDYAEEWKEKPWRFWVQNVDKPFNHLFI